MYEGPPIFSTPLLPPAVGWGWEEVVPPGKGKPLFQASWHALNTPLPPIKTGGEPAPSMAGRYRRGSPLHPTPPLVIAVGQGRPLPGAGSAPRRIGVGGTAVRRGIGQECLAGRWLVGWALEERGGEVSFDSQSKYPLASLLQCQPGVILQCDKERR